MSYDTLPLGCKMALRVSTWHFGAEFVDASVSGNQVMFLSCLFKLVIDAVSH